MKSNNIFRGLFGNRKAEKKINKLNEELINKNKQIEKLEKENEISEKTIKIYEEKLENKNNLIKIANISLDEKVETIKKLKDEIRKLNGSKGGYTTKINNLEKELAETKNKLEESMTDKYLIRKLPAGKEPSKQKVRTSKSRISSQTKKKLNEINEIRYEDSSKWI